MPELGLFGKIPAKGDFVRHNVVDDAARSFEQWLQESNDALRGAGAELPSIPLRAVFTPPGSAVTVLAAIVPSQDQVGRKYPLVVFSLVPTANIGPAYSVVPLAYAPFFDAAIALAQRGATMDLEQLKAALGSLPDPGPIEFGQAQRVCEQVLAAPLASEVHRRMFGSAEGMHLYAYQTFLTACQEAARNDPGKPVTVLDCPIHVDVDLFVWLELARRVYGFPPAHPAFFWAEDPQPRLLLSLGPPPLPTMQFLANPQMEHQRLWPLRTQRGQAVDAARNSLGRALGHLNEQAPLSALMETLSQRAAAGTLR